MLEWIEIAYILYLAETNQFLCRMMGMSHMFCYTVRGLVHHLTAITMQKNCIKDLTVNVKR